MNGKLTITVGIPGSGKTHEASFILHNEGRESVELVSRDDLRHLLFRSEGILTNAQELRVTAIEKQIVKDGLRQGKHVVVHDTNLRERYRKAWAELAAKQGAEFVILDLTQVPLDVCVSRNMRRADKGQRYVANSVIYDLHKKFVQNQPPIKYPVVALSAPVSHEPYVPDLSLPKAIIVDVDGTVASCEGVRSPYDYSRVQFDKPKQDVIDFVRHCAYDLNWKILFVSGRLDTCYLRTEEWLYENVKVPIEMLSMRHADGIDDTVIKYNIFDKLIRDSYNVQFALDDRNRVVEMWRSIDLLCLQVAEGDF